ncbi:MAG TPA: hypothetical protein VFA51_00680 [Candidatus Udaeobacter sp.]|nr:hypothetical protein [Candidatus Udaeobacter sp.]
MKPGGKPQPWKQEPKAGEWVEVRSKDEILATLDEKGQLEGMPFMPEMFRFCGQRFQVYKRAHKTCDTVFPVRGRRVHRAVHLNTRCDGSAHGGCQAGCLIFWKEAWLKPVDGRADETATRSSSAAASENPTKCTEWDVNQATHHLDETGTPVYSCQATRLPYFTTDLNWWDLRQYFEDYRSGNVGLRRIMAGLVYSLYYNLSEAGIGMGAPMRWLYDKFAPLWTKTRFPRHSGPIPVGQPTPTGTRNLQPGDLVRVKPHHEILATLNEESRNRGLRWDAEMVPYCGGTYRVLKRVTKIINERTGKMQEIKNPCIILDSVFCQSRYSACRMFCPRSIYSYWREIWLDKIEERPTKVESVATTARKVAEPMVVEK